MDNYYEQQLIKEGPKTQSGDSLKFVLMGGFGIALFFAALVTLVVAVNEAQWALLAFTVIFGGLGIFLFIKKDEAYTEYEYVYYMGELEIAKVLNNKKRKEMCKITCAEIEVFGKTTAQNFNRYITMPDAKKAYATFSKKGGENTYFLVYISPKNKVVLLFDPDEELLSNIKKHLRVSIER